MNVQGQTEGNKENILGNRKKRQNVHKKNKKNYNIENLEMKVENGRYRRRKMKHRNMKNGKLINKMIQEEDLILLNIDSRCKGTYTWQRGEQKSAIDLIMVNQCGYEKFDEMEVDEKREI